ncbi:MAG TPA: peptide deformylase [Alphaproteobacteria bacterium]|nr:peptide deformylase [Alphaproteobacteria bacterium]
MALLPILTAPDPRLKVMSKPVAKVDDSIRRLMDDMLATMYASEGLGLAAPQVGVPKRVIVMDLARHGEKPNPIMLANPEVIWRSEEEMVCEEGCLSVPDQYSEVSRPKAVRIRYLDYQNEIREMDAEGYLATCLQHEIDHLNGILFIDRLSSLRRNIILRKLVKARKLAAPV